VTQSNFFILMILLAGVIVILAYLWQYRRSVGLLQQWANDNGYQLLHYEYRLFRRGPFFWTTSRDQTVFYVEAVDRGGWQRTGYARCGSWWFGLFSNKVDVKWDN
jgi:hypothetical protein